MNETEDLIGSLKPQVPLATSLPKNSEGQELLLAAFQQFSSETSRLESAYLQLKSQYEQISFQLEERTTALKHKVRELNATSGYLELILDSMGQGLLFVSTEGIISTYNPAAEQILGHCRKEVLFRPFWERFPDTLFGPSLKKLLRQEVTPYPLQLRLPNPEGQNRELEVTFTRLPGEGAIPSGLVILLRDVTELLRWQRLASRNDRLKDLGEMAASVAHEIRNPLGGVEGFAALLVRDLQDKPHQRQMAEQIVEGSRGINRLITHVLQYARPVELSRKETDLKELCLTICNQALMDKRRSEQHQVILMAPDTLHPVAVDRQLLSNALMNVIINGFEAMPQGGTVSIQLAQQEKETWICLRDQGIGIPPENIEKIFSPFFTTKHNGNGFGLAEVHKTVQAHGGTLEVTSQVGEGTVFTVVL